MRLPRSRPRREAQASGITHRSASTGRFPPEQLYFSAEGMELRISLPGGRNLPVSRGLAEQFLRECFFSRSPVGFFTAETVASMLNDLLLSAKAGLVSVTIEGDRVAVVDPGPMADDGGGIRRTGRRSRKSIDR